MKCQSAFVVTRIACLLYWQTIASLYQQIPTFTEPMRLYPFLLLLAPVVLVSCNPDPSAGPRVDLVGSSRFLSASRTSTTTSTSPIDTFSTRMFAEKREDGDPDLRRLLITVEYSPTRNPYVYPNAGFEYRDIPSDPPLVFLDSVLTGAQRQSVAFEFTANTRSTPGREIWRFKAENESGEGDKTMRSFTLRLRPSNADSLLTYHRYVTTLQAPVNYRSRSYISLLPGLALPAFSLRQHAENQNLIDLVYLPLSGGGRALAAPNDADFVRRSAFWNSANRRATKLRSTALDSAAFTATTTPAQLTAAYNTGGTVSTTTGVLPLRGTGRVFAFQTADNPAKTGLIFVQSVVTVPTPALRIQVRITK